MADKCVPEVQRIEVNPGIDRKIAAPEVPAASVRDFNYCGHAIETKCPIHFATGKGGAVFQCTVVSAHNIERVVITWPPTNQARGRGRAQLGQLGDKSISIAAETAHR